MFFPAKIKVFLALRKSYSLWKGISLFDACKHVFGQQFAEYFASSLGRGVWGTEAEDLEFAAAFPDLFEAIVENEKSTNKLSLMKLVKKLGAEKAAYWQNELGTIDPKFEKGLYTFKGGLQTLTDALREELKSSAAKIESVKVSRISSQNKEYYLQTKSQKYGPFNKVIFTCNPTELGALFKDYKKEVATHLSKAQYSPITVVHMAFNRKKFSTDGFGFLVPRKEKISMLGTLFSSNIFPHKADKKTFLTKTMIAGDTKLFDDDEVVAMAKEGLKRAYGLKADPEFSKVARHSPGIPRYFNGFSEWKSELDTMLQDYPGLHLLGWNYQGIGLANCLENAYKLGKVFDNQ